MTPTGDRASAAEPRARASHGSYKKFVSMIAVSMIVMYGLMYLHTYAIDHVYWSQTRGYLALIMGSGMALVMLAFMRSMYRNRRANLLIVAGAGTVLAVSVGLVRTQVTVDDVAYMRAMIPHHSIAILTSERAQIRDPRVRELADEIIASQTREIAEMKALISDLDE